jgi:hypothetical protein
MAKVITRYEHETPTEEAARKALDQATMTSFDSTLQMHCGLMRMAALFVTQPKLSTLQGDWIAWLKNAAQTYPQIVASVADPRLAEDPGGDHGGEKSKPADDVNATLRNLSMRESPIGPYLGFQSWGDKKPGNWRVADVPKFYFEQVLTPLRQAPSDATLAAWDVYIAMMNADQSDPEEWTDVDYPALQFQKACDDYAAAQTTDKLQALVTLIKAHPSHPQLDDWISRVHDMIQALQAQRAGAAQASSTSTTSALPPVAPDGPNTPAVSTPAH